jgi:dihydroorotase
MTALSILAARVIDPATGEDMVRDVHVQSGMIVSSAASGARQIDGRGKILVPGLVDARQFRIDPLACAAGGITRACLMPDLSPPLEHSAAIAQAASLGDASVSVLPFVAATKGLRGEEIAEIALGKRAGAIAVATGRKGISSARVMERLLTYARGFDLPVIVHAEDDSLTENAVATSGDFATRMGLPAAPSWAEALRIERDIRIARETGARLHIAQVTTADGINLVRSAKAHGLPISCGVTPAHMLLNDYSIGQWRTFAHLSPPLRRESDRQAVLAGLIDGTIDLVCSGHDPRSAEDKRVPYAQSAPGMAGSETMITHALSLSHNGHMQLPQVIALLTTGPARMLGLPLPSLDAGQAADMALIDIDAPWILNEDSLLGAGRNTPFEGQPQSGRVMLTLRHGLISFQR